MKNFLTFIFIALLGIVATKASAYTSKAPIKYGKISLADLTMKSYAADPSAPAVVLCDFSTVRVGARTEYTRHVRIKIISEEGLSYAKLEIPYRFYNHYEVFGELKAETFNLNDKGEILKTKTSYKDISEVEVDSRYHKKIVQFPDVKVGSVIECTYTIVSLDFVKLRDWYFQTAIPVLWSEYRVSVPSKFNYLISYQKGRALTVDEQKGFAEKIQWLYNNKLKQIYGALYKNNDVLYQSPLETNTVYFVHGRTMKFVMKNMPALKNAASCLADNSQQVKVHLYMASGYFPWYYDYLLQTANDEYDTWDISEMRVNRNRRGYIAYWLPTWDEMNTKWIKSDNLGMRTIKAFNYKPLLDEASGNGVTGEHLAFNIFNVITNYVKWNGNYGIYADNDFDKVLKKQSGSGPELNLMLAFLLKRAGFSDVDIVLVKTKDQGRVENIYPVKGQFNHLVIQLVIENKVYYLDASGPSPQFNKLSNNVQGVDGWLVRKENYGWVKITSTNDVTTVTEI